MPALAKTVPPSLARCTGAPRKRANARTRTGHRAAEQRRIEMSDVADRRLP